MAHTTDSVRDNESPEALTVDEVAQLLRCDRKSAYALIRKRKLPAARIGRSIRVARSAVLDFLGGRR